jgi:biotin carboxyl carrier protein
MQKDYRIDGNQRSAEARLDNGQWSLSLDGQPLEGITVQSAAADHVVLLRDGCRLEAFVARRGSERLVFIEGKVHTLHIAGDDDDDQEAIEVGGPRLVSDMPGKVVKVFVSEGDQVEAGAPLLILEAMKMETEITAPVAGRVATVAVTDGATVAVGDLLVDIEPEEDTSE